MENGGRRGFISRTWLLIQLASWAITIHMVEIAMWGLFFWWKKCLPDFESSLYFAVVTYTTVGYGDLVLAKGWRLVAGVEALTGILMCGWSTGFFFVVASSCTVRAWAQERIEMMKPSIHTGCSFPFPSPSFLNTLASCRHH